MSESGHEHGLSRRGFVTGVVSLLGGVIAAIIGIPAIGYLISPALKKQSGDDWVPLGQVDTLPEGVPTLFSFTRTQKVGWERTANTYGVYVIRHTSGNLDVFSNICTHLSCRVTWNETDNQFICPCHDGRFAKDGSIVSGPQPRPLDRFEYQVEDGTLKIHIVEV